MTIKNLKNNFCFSVTDAVNNICQPLFEHTEVDYVAYLRIYNNKMLVIESNHGFGEWFLANEKYNVSRPTTSPKERSHKGGYYLSDSWNKNNTHPELISLVRDEQNIFQHHHGLLKMRTTDDYNEILSFNTSVKSTRMNDWYLANLDVFDKFIAYFKEKAAPLIQQAEKNCFQVIEYKSIGEARYDADIGLITEQHLYAIKNKINLQYALLTPREKECVYWLFCGKNVPEIALILGISKRTVEKFIMRIKEKFDCCTLFQLGKVLATSCDKLMLMEKLNCLSSSE